LPLLIVGGDRVGEIHRGPVDGSAARTS
jgi:hypothetical protein